MAQQLADQRDQNFVIWDQMQCEDILAHDNYREFNRKTCDMILTEARALAIKELLPLLAEGDKQGVTFDAGRVKVPEGFHRVYQLILEGEWNNLGVREETEKTCQHVAQLLRCSAIFIRLAVQSDNLI